MTPEQFTYWLQGYTEINGEAPTPEQWEVIKDHLKLVFDKRTPDGGADLFRDWTQTPPSAEPLPDSGARQICGGTGKTYC